MSQQAKGISALPYNPINRIDVRYLKDKQIRSKDIKSIQKELDLTFDEIIDGFDSTKEPFNLTKKHMDRRLKRAFDQEVTMLGDPWQRLKLVTLQRKSRAGVAARGSLRQTGRLRGAVSKGDVKGGRTGFTRKKRHALLYDPTRRLGVRGRKAASLHVHQKGSLKNRTPARPFIGMAFKDEQKINELFRNWAITNLKSG